MKKFTYMLLLVCVFPVWLQAQNLDRMSKNRRNSILVAKAKEAVLKYGPGYYREYGFPIIKREKIRKIENSVEEVIKGRYFYSVTFPYDPNIETLSLQYAARVTIWANTGEVFSILFGSGAGFINIDKREPDIQIPYQNVVIEVIDWESFNDSIFKVIEMEERRDSIMNLNK